MIQSVSVGSLLRIPGLDFWYWYIYNLSLVMLRNLEGTLPGINRKYEVLTMKVRGCSWGQADYAAAVEDE